MRLELRQHVETGVARAKVVDGSDQSSAAVLVENRFQVRAIAQLLAPVTSNMMRL